jgi:HEAT repeat protein
LEKFDQETKVKELLKEAAKDPKVPNTVKQSVMSLLGVIGVDDLEFLKMMLDFPVGEMNDLGVVFNAIRAMGESKDPKATDILVDLLLNRYPSGSLARGVIIDSLRSRQDKRAVPALIAVLREDRERVNRYQAAELLGDWQAPEAVDELIKALDDPESETLCSYAAEALGKIGDRRAAPEIKRIIDNLPHDPRFELRMKDSENDMAILAIKKAYRNLAK